MKRLTRTLLVGALVVAVAAISAAPAGAAKGGTDRPYKASGSGTITTNNCAPGQAPDGRGLAIVCDQITDTPTWVGTHIGRSTGSGQPGSEYWLPLGDPPFIGPIPNFIPCEDEPGTIEFENRLFVETVAANGDKLFSTITGSGCIRPPGAPPVADTLETEGHYEITGGTGRFEGATGEGTVTTTVDTTGDPETGQSFAPMWEGTISY